MFYKMKYQEFNQEIRKFVRGGYGKAIFVICYTIFFLFFIATLYTLFLAFINHQLFLFYLLLTLSSISMVSILIGSYFFYKEVRIFSMATKKSEKNDL